MSHYSASFPVHICRVHDDKIAGGHLHGVFLSNCALIPLEVAKNGVSGQTISRGNSITHPLRAHEFYVSRWMMRRIFFLDGDLSYDEAGLISWPSGVVASLSHKNGLVGLLIQPSRQFISVGFDIEFCQVNSALANKVGEPDEFALMRHCSESVFQDSGKLVSCLFSAKEALFKMCYPIGRKMFWFLDARLVAIIEDSEAGGGFVLTFEVNEKANLPGMRLYKIYVRQFPLIGLGMNDFQNKDVWFCMGGILK